MTALLSLAGHGVVWQVAAIILATFVLEDAATVMAAMASADGDVALPAALAALYAGIVLGDLGLYGLGRLAARVRLLRRWLPDQRIAPAAHWLRPRVFRVVMVSRFLPGMRLPTYTACGFLRASLRRFALAAVVATLIWTSLLFGLSLHVGHWLIAHFGAWRWAGAAGFALALVLLLRGAARLQQAAAR